MGAASVKDKDEGGKGGVKKARLSGGVSAVAPSQASPSVAGSRLEQADAMSTATGFSGATNKRLASASSVHQWCPEVH